MLFFEDLSVVATVRRKNNIRELQLPTLSSISAPDCPDQAACEIAERCLGMDKEHVNLLLCYTYFTYRVFVATTKIDDISQESDEIVDCGWMTMNMCINDLHSYLIYSCLLYTSDAADEE